MFRKRGRPPEAPLQIGGYDNPSQEESNQIPAHQLRDAPRQLPLPAVREFEQSAIVQQGQPGFSNAIVESSSLQQQCDVDMLDSHNRRLSINPQEVMSPNQAIPNMPPEVDTFNLQRLLPQRSEEKVLKHSLFIVCLNKKTPKNANFINFVFCVSHIPTLIFLEFD